jgi:hypothetical protein
LQGSAENPQAIGAIVRPASRGGKLGSAHEIRMGGGYWSQDSTDVVLGPLSEIEALEIRWPGGFAERVPVSAGTRTITRRAPRAATVSP